MVDRRGSQCTDDQFKRLLNAAKELLKAAGEVGLSDHDVVDRLQCLCEEEDEIQACNARKVESVAWFIKNHLI